MNDNVNPARVREVADFLKDRWSDGVRQPALSNDAKRRFPGLDLQTFNRAADLAWSEIGGAA